MTKRDEIESWSEIYLNHDRAAKRSDKTPSRPWIFKKLVDLCWGKDNQAMQFVWHPWAEKMNEVVHSWKYPALNGCASSGKTYFLAAFAIVNWLVHPLNTLVMVTSTDLKASRKRIWGAIVELFMAAPFLPGKLVDSQGMINMVNEFGNKMPDKSGISLVAGERKKEKEALGKLIGAKNKRVILIADELPELSEAILETALGNLDSNPYFQMIASGNFKSRYDPFGTFCLPKAGYDSLTVDSTEWETMLGYCVRFDGMKSPNILEGRSGKDLYPGIYGPKQLEGHRRDLGENSASFWRMCRSYESQMGHNDSIYTEADFIAGNAYGSAVWRDEPTVISGMDPAFTNGGDRSIQWIAKWGMTIEGIQVLRLEKMYILRENVLLKEHTRNFQVAKQFIDNCKTHGVSPQNAGLDTTGAGAVLADIVCELWGTANITRVDFSGAPSEMQVRAYDEKTSKQSYDRKVTELWYVGLEFTKHRQVRGLTPELARELKARQYDTLKSADGLKIRAEPKSDMKERLGFSPDEADAFAVTLHVARERLGALAGSGNAGMMAVARRWHQQHEAAGAVYQNVNYEPEKIVA